MTVSSQTLAFEYAANGVTTTFAYGFRVLYADQVKVYVNGALQVGGYTLTGVGDAVGGNVVFTVAPVNGSTVLVRRISDRVRTTDFQQAPYFTQEELLDQDQDYQTMLLQEAAADATNALRIPAVETNNVELPDAAARANKAVVFDENGDVAVSEDDYADQAANAAASAAAALASQNAAEAAAIAAEASADRVDLGALDQAVEDSEAARDIANEQAGIASAQAMIATTQAGLAGTARADAQAAAVAALAAAQTYISTAAGIAATTSGQVFLVTTADTQVYSVYNNNAGSAVLLGTLNIADGEVYALDSRPGLAVAFEDEQGRVALGVKDDGTTIAAALEIGDIEHIIPDAAVYIYSIQDDEGNVALGVRNNGEVVIGSLLAQESNITPPTPPDPVDPFPYSDEGSVVYALGDSTVAAFAGGTAILDLVNTSRTRIDLAVPGHTIGDQLGVWNAQTIVGPDVGWVVVQIGLNDVNTTPGSSASVLASLQNLIDVIRSEIGPRRLLVSQMIPCRQRWIDLFGPVNGLIAQQNWVDINLGIAGFGPTPITDVDGRITEHVELMSDNMGNLKAEFDTGDAIHPNTAGRQVNATQWDRAIRRTTVQV